MSDKDWKKEALALVVLLRAKCSDEEWANMESRFAAATPHELELEQEADGRWLAAYTRFPGVAAYGPTKEEAIRNAAKVLIESGPADTIDDGFGNSWSAYCPTCKRWYHESCAPKLFGSSASPTPDKCPRCGSGFRGVPLIVVATEFFGGQMSTAMRTEMCSDSWHSSAGTPKSRDTGVSLDGGKTIHSKFKND